MKQSEPKPRTPMTDLEVRAACALARCTFVPGSSPKSFARNMAAIAGGSKQITEGQRAYLWSAVWHFRRQIKDKDVLVMAEAFKDLRLAEADTG